jgi:hypothetical protein
LNLTFSPETRARFEVNQLWGGSDRDCRGAR